MRRLLVALVVPVALATACSSGTTSTSSGTPATPTTTVATTVPPTSAAGSATSSAGSPTTTAGTPTSSAPPAPAAWLTFGSSADRRGFVATGPDPGAIAQAWSSDQLDGALYGEPIVSGGRVVVATQHDSVYAFDATTGQPAWNTNLGDPVPRSARAGGTHAATVPTASPGGRPRA